MTRSMHSLLGLALLLGACGARDPSILETLADLSSDPGGEREGSVGDSPGHATTTSEPSDGEDVDGSGCVPGVDPGAAQNQGSAAAAACDGGWEASSDDSRECAATVDSLCFESVDAACSCAGCALDACIVAESYPSQVGCEASNSCDFTSNGECFATVEEACSAAGCTLPSCIILESYPAQAECEG